ncbi:hypothetical protein BLNAU_16451 [Blattamonas nauphoetae]|uniref:Uncharacterized protein n=1 Tax=Blattamonas nauphoetae TaxID=2049346 RepID=A0ABQ9XBH6_9EUKA|nr:hypothetical protein BLNAU_16451 [Blattamonas nauphoetae]
MKLKLSLVKDRQRPISSYLTQEPACQYPNPDVEDRLEELDALMSFLVALSDSISFDYNSVLLDSGLFPAILAQSLPSDESLDGYLGSMESLGYTRDMANISFPIIPFVKLKCVEEIRPGALRVSQSFGLFEPLIQKNVTVSKIVKFKSFSSQFHSNVSFLCGLMGAESLETRQCVLQALYDCLDGIFYDSPLPKWLVTETTPFSVKSDGTLKNETLLRKLLILLAESMEAIDTLLPDVCDENLKTLSNHCTLVASVFSCLALLGERNKQAAKILNSMRVLQQIGAWAGSLLEIPPSPARNEALLSVIQILVDFGSLWHGETFLSLDLVFPDSSTRIADLLSLIEPLITINSVPAKTAVATYLGQCPKYRRPDSEETSLLFACFNKFIDSEGILGIDFEQDRFHFSITLFLTAHLFHDESSNLNRIDTPPLRAYLRRLLLSHGRSDSKLRGISKILVENISEYICHNMASLLFWKDVGGVAAIVHALTLEDHLRSRFEIFTAIYKHVLFPTKSTPTPEQQTLVLRELEEEGLSDAVEMANHYLQKLPEWNAAVDPSSDRVEICEDPY